MYCGELGIPKPRRLDVAKRKAQFLVLGREVAHLKAPKTPSEDRLRKSLILNRMIFRW
jgi:hypothetical protein